MKYTEQDVFDAIQKTRENVDDDLPEAPENSEMRMAYRIGAVNVLTYLDK